MKLPHVIIEGADGSGKTTLYYTLVNRGWTKGPHFGPPPKGPKLMMMQHSHGLMIDLAAKLRKAKQPTVVDRAWLGERVYAPIKRGYTPTWLHGYYERSQIPKDLLLVVLTAHKNVLTKRAFDRGENYVSRDELSLVDDSFREQFELSKCRYKTIIDTTYMQPKDVGNAVINCIEAMRGEYKKSMIARCNASSQSFEER